MNGTRCGYACDVEGTNRSESEAKERIPSSALHTYSATEPNTSMGSAATLQRSITDPSDLDLQRHLLPGGIHVLIRYPILRLRHQLQIEEPYYLAEDKAHLNVG